MGNKYLKHIMSALSGLFFVLLIYSCASIGNPNGGPYDEAPPKYITSTPVPNKTNHQGKKIEILFDELIQLEKPSENVIITPPQMQTPIIRAIGKKVTVELQDTLQENTTYTIDFTNSIVDNNEKNVLENFTFAFSTGDVIDTLEVSGFLLNAENLEPMPGITIGLHRNLEDSAFTHTPFDRTSRTNERGKFTIRNISPGTYRIYALNDVNRDYTFDQPGEDIAYNEEPITPTFELTTREDTTWVDSLTIDTIRTVAYTRFMPDDIQLFLFKEKFARQYMLRPERPESHLFVVKYNAPLDTVPLPVPVNFEPQDSSWYYIQTADMGTTVNFWITDSTVWKQDSLQLSFTYPKSDSLNILVPQTDTIQANMRRRPEEKKKSKKKTEEPEPIQFLEMAVSTSSSMNNFDTLFVTFNEPVLEVSKDLFFLNQLVDTLWVPVDFEFKADSVNTLRYYLERKWKYSEEYMLEVDSASIFSVYGRWNNGYNGKLKIKSADEYGNLYINIHDLDTTAFVELLNANDQPVRKVPVSNGGVLFMDLKPDKYYARLIVDENNNGVWDTGNYAEKRQAERVYYYPGVFEVLVNWDKEEDWHVLDTPIDRQKPLDITKNKPKEVTKKQRDYRNEGRSQSSSSNRGGFSF
ncbi:Ig-like domain-containing protein [Parabacteroides sp. PF5-6]|uniref:Ig-like domain-containing protein n=1 Tax=Parabacteroides sp. PF5-6 TaxID=1742403 RepID=UPI002404FAC5|nr:Ig-like domain-containing protein [Parabacteroides sp. PF5-6]MDF9830501.1 uncharacterized protein (DUF2141 family) [Parabacteroides sp. PF5-6]